MADNELMKNGLVNKAIEKAGIDPPDAEEIAKAGVLGKGTFDRTINKFNQAYLGGKVYSFFGAYYYAAIRSCKMPTGSTGYPDEAGSEWRSGFLDNAGVTTGDKVHIYINEEDMGEHVLINSNVIGEFHDGDTIMCHFNPYIVESTDTLINDSMFRHKFMFRQPAIGTVSHDGTTMVIKFQSIRPYTTWGITNKGTHKNSSDVYGENHHHYQWKQYECGCLHRPIRMSDTCPFQIDMFHHHHDELDAFLHNPSRHHSCMHVKQHVSCFHPTSMHDSQYIRMQFQHESY